MKRRIDLCEIEFSQEACEISPETAITINEVVSPIKPVKPDDVYVRAMFVTSDRLNSQGGRFQRDEIEELCRLIPGAPVLVGHDKRRLPIARCFKVETVDRSGESWIKVWFYWLRDTEGADDLLKNIDGGICTECSLGFSFKLPECSICGGDIRKCSHVPGREYRGASGQMELCHFLYRKITRVNEISLVYRGAVPGTAISEQEINGELCNGSFDAILGGGTFLSSPGDIDLPDDGVLLTPIYHGVPFKLEHSGQEFRITAPESWLQLRAVERMFDLLREMLPEGASLHGVITLNRGKSRMPLYQMERALSGSSSHSGRWGIKLYADSDLLNCITESEIDRLSKSGIELVLPWRVTGNHGIESAIANSPKEGLAINLNGESFVCRDSSRFLLRVVEVTNTRSGKFCYTLSSHEGDRGEQSYKSYETPIAADVGDTLYVEADVIDSEHRMNLRRIKVLDNLRGYFAPDRLDARFGRAAESTDCFSAYSFGNDAVVFEIPFGSNGKRQIVFPHYSEKLLGEGKIMVGQHVENLELTGESGKYDSGAITILESSDDGVKFRCEGRRLNGEYILRSAILQKEKVVLLYRAG